MKVEKTSAPAKKRYKRSISIDVCGSPACSDCHTENSAPFDTESERSYSPELQAEEPHGEIRGLENIESQFDTPIVRTYPEDTALCEYSNTSLDEQITGYTAEPLQSWDSPWESNYFDFTLPIVKSWP
jgi:hypothetical protein